MKTSVLDGTLPEANIEKLLNSATTSPLAKSFVSARNSSGKPLVLYEPLQFQSSSGNPAPKQPLLDVTDRARNARLALRQDKRENDRRVAEMTATGKVVYEPDMPFNQTNYIAAGRELQLFFAAVCSEKPAICQFSGECDSDEENEGGSSSNKWSAICKGVPRELFDKYFQDYERFRELRTANRVVVCSGLSLFSMSDVENLAVVMRFYSGRVSPPAAREPLSPAGFGMTLSQYLRNSSCFIARATYFHILTELDLIGSDRYSWTAAISSWDACCVVESDRLVLSLSGLQEA